MPKCHHCGTTIVFGGVRHGDWRYCNQTCHDNDVLRAALDEIPPGFVEEKAQLIYEGACPRCGGRGPNEVHMTYSIWALAIMTHFAETPLICCQACGTRSRLKAILSSGLFGWWSMQGVFLTPVQIARNLHGLMGTSDTSRPSPALVAAIRDQLAKRLIEESRSSGDA